MSGVFSNSVALQPMNGNLQAANAASDEFLIRFWGVRGNIPTPGIETVRYGGNTACIEVLVGGQRLVFDGGTGLRVLGKHMQKEMPVTAHLFFTHTYWDRIQGFPFFVPAFIPGNCFHVYGAMGQNGASIKQRLGEQMLRPNFPVPLQEMQSTLTFNNIHAGSVITLGDVVVETISLNRPNAALGFRVTWEGYSMVYATDTEHTADGLDQSLLYLSQGADLLIYDAYYAEHDHYGKAAIARPIATWESGIEVANVANVKQVVMFHHDPMHDDDFLDRVETEVQARFANVQLAREGMAISLVKA